MFSDRLLSLLLSISWPVCILPCAPPDLAIKRPKPWQKKLLPWDGIVIISWVSSLRETNQSWVRLPVCFIQGLLLNIILYMILSVTASNCRQAWPLEPVRHTHVCVDLASSPVYTRRTIFQRSKGSSNVWSIERETLRRIVFPTSLPAQSRDLSDFVYKMYYW